MRKYHKNEYKNANKNTYGQNGKDNMIRKDEAVVIGTIGYRGLWIRSKIRS